MTLSLRSAALFGGEAIPEFKIAASAFDLLAMTFRL